MRKERFPNGGQQKQASLRFNVPMGAFRTDLTGWGNRLAISLYIFIRGNRDVASRGD